MTKFSISAFSKYAYFCKYCKRRKNISLLLLKISVAVCICFLWYASFTSIFFRSPSCCPAKTVNKIEIEEQQFCAQSLINFRSEFLWFETSMYDDIPIIICMSVLNQLIIFNFPKAFSIIDQSSFYFAMHRVEIFRCFTSGALPSTFANSNTPAISKRSSSFMVKRFMYKRTIFPFMILTSSFSSKNKMISRFRLSILIFRQFFDE